jgi:hypothetical protein
MPYRRVAGRMPIDDGARGIHRGRRPCVQRDRRARVSDRRELFERERVAVERDPKCKCQMPKVDC